MPIKLKRACFLPGGTLVGPGVVNTWPDGVALPPDAEKLTEAEMEEVKKGNDKGKRTPTPLSYLAPKPNKKAGKLGLK